MPYVTGIRTIPLCSASYHPLRNVDTLSFPYYINDIWLENYHLPCKVVLMFEALWHLATLWWICAITGYQIHCHVTSRFTSLSWWYQVSLLLKQFILDHGLNNCLHYTVLYGMKLDSILQLRLFNQPFIQTQIKENIKGPRRPVNSPHKWPVTRKIFPFNDVIMG